MSRRHFKTIVVLTALIIALHPCMAFAQHTNKQVVRHARQHHPSSKRSGRQLHRLSSKSPSTPTILTKQLSKEMLIKIKSMPYNDQTYTTAFKVLLFNSQIHDAYDLALIAVDKQPDDLRWHENLARTAIWVEDYNTGMAQWLFIAQHTTNPETIKYAASMASNLSYTPVLVDILKIYIKKQPISKPSKKMAKYYLELANAQNEINQPRAALRTIKTVNTVHPSRASYELMAKVYKETDRWKKALETWEYINKTFGPDIKSVSEEAKIYYSKGQFKQAVAVLAKGIPIAKKTDEDFWQILGDLSWLINNRQLAIVGYSHNLNDPSNLLRLVELEMSSNLPRAFDYALRGWQVFHQQVFLSPVLYLTQLLRNWEKMNELLVHLNTKQLHEIQKTPLFWEAQSSLFAAYGADTLQRDTIAQGLKLHPELTVLKNDMMWLLMNSGMLQWVKSYMQQWVEQHINNKPLLWHAFAEGFNVINQYNTSLRIYQQHLLDDLQNGQIFIDYANILEKAKQFQLAHQVRLYLWHKTLLKLNVNNHVDKDAIQTISQIAPFFISGTEQVGLFNLLIGDNTTDQDINIILNWIVQRDYYELMGFFKTYYLNNQLPAWASIHLALVKNDLPTLQTAIKNAAQSWPRSDRINAAVRLENIPLALNLAFDELTERPNANEIFPEFTLYALQSANNFQIREEYEQFVSVIGPRTGLQYRSRLTNRWAITPSVSLWSIKTNNPSVMTNVPASDFQSNVKINHIIHRGLISYNLGYNYILNGFTPVSIDLNYQLNSTWTGVAKLGFNQEPFQNAYLRIGGVQDQVNLGLMKNLSQRDLLSGEYQGINYYSQDRHYLANGYNLMGSYKHKFWLSYPDYTVGLFSNLYHFNRNGSYGGNITTLFPSLTPEQQLDPALVASTQNANYKQIIPVSYSEGGIMFSFGDTILEYTNAWRPFFWLSIYYNSITYLSNNIKLGLNGSVFGRDSLKLYAERGTAQSNANQINYLVGIQYSLYS